MHSLITYWHLDGVMAVFLILLCLGYFNLTGFILTKKTNYFFAGYLLIILSVASPLHFLGENYLMSAHMLSHVILLLIAGPLMVMGIPENIHNKYLDRFSKLLFKIPLLAWITGVIVMWFWHIPAIFNFLFENRERILENGHTNLMHLFLQNLHPISLIGAGIIFSWPVVGPIPSRRIAPLNAVLYLSGACVLCSILGLLITFAPVGIYTYYEHITDRFGFLNLIRNNNGISLLVDQQMAGLIMWVPGCLIYLSASMYLLIKWFKEKTEPPIFISMPAKP